MSKTLCDFCGKTSKNVPVMVRGLYAAAICNRCAAEACLTAMDWIAENLKRKNTKPKRKPKKKPTSSTTKSEGL